MHVNTKLSVLIISALLAMVFIAGCSGNGGSAPAPTAAVTTPTTVAPLYSAGDVVKNPKSSSTFALLILGYDPATDKYERSLIYPNSDGSWGYRMNANTDSVSRVVVERDYTDKVTALEPSSVLIGTAARATTMATTAVTSTTHPASVTTTTTLVPIVSTVPTTGTSANSPAIKNIIPDEGYAGDSLLVTDLSGENFMTGATVKLVRSGYDPIIATNIQVSVPAHITCTLKLPGDAKAGTWDVVVVNPGGKSATYTNLFLLHTRPGTSTTTASGSTGGIPITSLDPNIISSSGYVPVTITGSNFLDGITATLKKEYKPDIPANLCSRSDTTRMTCFFQIPAGSQGTWDMVLLNTDQTNGKLVNALSVSA